MKKKVYIIGFVAIILSLILLNILLLNSGEFVSDDIFMDSFVPFILVVLNFFVLLPEIDILFNILYFISEKKTKSKTLLNIISLVCSIGMLFTLFLFGWHLKFAEICLLFFFATFILLRLIYIIIHISRKLKS